MDTKHTRHPQTAIRPPLVDAPMALMTVKDVSAMVRMQASWIYTELRAGKFPEPVIREVRMSRWLRTEIEAWIMEKMIAAKTTTTRDLGKKAGQAHAAKRLGLKGLTAEGGL